MKNQYFGDNKDLFKYDLLYWMMQAGLARHITFIPMLTPPDQSTDGGKTDRKKALAGTNNKELTSFLDRCVKENLRDIKQAERFFNDSGMKMTIYYGKDRFFSHKKRQEYFAGIAPELLIDSIIVVDPDNGLEVKHSGDRHLLFSEAKNLYDRMHETSILMLFQHFPRRDHHDYLHERSDEVAEKISGEHPLVIENGEAIFFLLTKEEELENDLTGLLEHYAGEYS